MVGVPSAKRLPLSTTPSRQAMNSTESREALPSTPGHQVPRTMPSTPIRAPSTPSAHASGSENRLAAIITALKDIDLTSHYVVVRGERPGVYSSRFVSTNIF